MIVRDVSFVVVARDEALAMRRCLDAILGLDLVECEVICVDSASSDETPSILRGYAEAHANVTFISVPGCRNAAEARNAGKGRAGRRWIFFVDGDVELYAPFLDAALAELTSGAADAATGGLDEQLYADASGERMGKPYVRRRFPGRTELMSCGGTFIASRQLVEAVGDYDERFDRSQDLDYSMRLSARAMLVGLPIRMGCHHTKEYRTRPWQHVKNGYVLCQGMLARKHLGRRGFGREWLRSRKSYVSGLILTAALLGAVLLVVRGALDWRLFGAGLVVLLLVESIYSAYRKQTLLASLVIHFISPPMIVAGFVIEPFTRRRAGAGAGRVAP